jgi:hypothetical protein
MPGRLDHRAGQRTALRFVIKTLKDDGACRDPHPIPRPLYPASENQTSHLPQDPGAPDDTQDY